jgi:hypothetical protein
VAGELGETSRSRWGEIKLLAKKHARKNSKEELNMSGEIDPGVVQPTTIQSFGQSDRNPAVATWGEGGGQIESPSVTEIRMTPEGPAVSPDVGL